MAGTYNTVSEVREDGRLVEGANPSTEMKGRWMVSMQEIGTAPTTIVRIGQSNGGTGGPITDGFCAAVVAFDHVLTEAEIQDAHNAIADRVAGRDAAIDAAIQPIALPRLITEVAPNAADFLRGEIPSPYDGIIDADGNDQGDQNTHPAVLDMEQELGAGQVWNGYRYWMAITPYPGSVAATENPCIFASSDGTTWVVPSGVTNPVVPYPGGENGLNADPDICMEPPTA